MTMHGGGGGVRTGPGSGGSRRVSSHDFEAQRQVNAEAPKIAGLFGRIAALFVPHRAGLVVTAILVLIGAALSVLPPLLVQAAFDRGLFPVVDGDTLPPNLVVLWWVVGGIVIVYLANALLGMWQTWLTASIGNQVMGALRVRLFTHLQGMDLGFFTRTKTGLIQSRLQNDVGGVASVLTNTVTSVLGNTVTVIAALVAMLVLSWQLTLVAVLLTPLMVIAQRRVGQVRARIAAATQESLSEMTAITQEALSVSGIQLSKSFNRQGAEIDRYATENRRLMRLQVRQQMSGQWFFAMVNVFMSAVPAFVYLVAGWLVLGGHHGVTAGTIVAFTTVQTRLLFPLMGLMRVALDVQTSGALFARIFEYLDLTPAINERPDARPVASDRAGLIEFDHVTFRYPGADDETRATLDDVSFTVQPGEFVGVVGASGAGKTTIAYLVPRIYDVSAGAVRFGGDDVRELRRDSLIANIGTVSQETYLFHATVAENLRYAKPGATDAELEAACRAANIHDTIDGFADGYDTVVGERGYRLSGGEKQRIAIARVLLKDPPVLVLDEATSALDNISERAVQRALDAAARGRTTIVIAHRLSTVRRADVILVMDAGRIVERGTHDELIAADGAYARLAREEHGRESTETGSALVDEVAPNSKH